MSVFLSQKWMENKLSFFYSAVWGKGRREEGARTRVHVSICEHICLCRAPWIKSNSGIFWTSGSWGPWQLYSFGRRSRETVSIKDISCNPFSLVTYSLDYGCLQFWNKVQFLKRCKSRKVLITIQAIWHENWCCGVSSAKMQISRWCTPVLASEYAFETIWMPGYALL